MQIHVVLYDELKHRKKHQNLAGQCALFALQSKIYIFEIGKSTVLVCFKFLKYPLFSTADQLMFELFFGSYLFCCYDVISASYYNVIFEGKVVQNKMSFSKYLRFWFTWTFWRPITVNCNACISVTEVCMYLLSHKFKNWLHWKNYNFSD